MASKPAAPSKRPPSTPSVPAAKPPCQIHPSAIIAEKAQITGSHAVEIGENAVLHPYARIRAETGRVVIGKGSTISESAVVGVEAGEEQDVEIGDRVEIESGAVVEAARVGDGTTIEVRAVIGKGAVVGRYCKIAPLERIEAGETLDDFVVVYGKGQRRVDKTLKEHAEIREAKRVGQEKSVELMKRLIPNASSKWM